MIKNVLVAVDGSKNTAKVLDFALDLTERYGATMTILNVSSSLGAMGTVPQEPVFETTGNVATFAKDMWSIHEATLKKFATQSKAAKPNLKISTMLRQGVVAIEIVKTAVEGGFDVIVLGHKESGKIREMVIGSTTERVIHSATCSVIIVK